MAGASVQQRPLRGSRRAKALAAFLFLDQIIASEGPAIVGSGCSEGPCVLTLAGSAYYRSQHTNTSAIAIQTVAQNSRPATQTSTRVSRDIGASNGGRDAGV